jgi:hypothetical protein
MRIISNSHMFFVVDKEGYICYVHQRRTACQKWIIETHKARLRSYDLAC